MAPTSQLTSLSKPIPAPAEEGQKLRNIGSNPDVSVGIFAPYTGWLNQPKAPVSNNQRDGAMQYAPYGGGAVNYEPNTLADGIPYETPTIPMSHPRLEGDTVRKKISLTNDFQQAGERYRSLSKVDQDHLVDNIVDPLGKANKQIQQRMVANLTKADPELGKRVATGLKL